LTFFEWRYRPRRFVERNNPNHWRNNPAIVLSALALLVVTVVPILVFGGGSLHRFIACLPSAASPVQSCKGRS
jgi:hypothetical protein